MKEITSRDNRLVKLAVRLQQKKYRYEERRLIAEGFRIVEDAVHTGITDGICLVAAEVVERPELQNLQAESEKVGWEWYLLPDRIYEKVKETHSSQGITAILPFFEYTFENLPEVANERPILYLEAIQDPGNLGTILRTAAAANVGAVFLSPDCVDLYNGKTVRSAMGAIFKVPVVQNVSLERISSFCDEKKRILTGTLLGANKLYTQVDWRQPTVIAFGNEGNGLSQACAEACRQALTIPMKSHTESLNLATSVAVVLYKAWEEAGFADKT